MQKVIVDQDTEVKEIISRIYSVLCQKVLRDKSPVDEMHRVNLGGVYFWFHSAKETGETYLLYNVNPKEWPQKEILEAVDELENRLLNSFTSG